VPGPPTRACYGEVTTEQIVTVDIDHDPTRALSAPTPEDYARARMMPPAK
jgi:hypothetical protein